MHIAPFRQVPLARELKPLFQVLVFVWLEVHQLPKLVLVALLFTKSGVHAHTRRKAEQACMSLFGG